MDVFSESALKIIEKKIKEIEDKIKTMSVTNTNPKK
jgi:hypothetical protein